MRVARVSLSSGGCSISDDDFNTLRRRASRTVTQAVNLGFGEFPIERPSYGRGVLALFSESNICTVLTADSGARPSNHNSIRKKYRAEGLGQAEAQMRGVIARQIPVRKSCPPGFGLEESTAYNDPAGCRDVFEKMGNMGLPTVLYAVDGDSSAAQSYIDRLRTAPLYTKYSNAGPVACVPGRDEAGRRYFESYHSLAVLFTSVRFAMRVFTGPGWTAWSLSPSCEAAGGRVLAADDLMFNFGMRVFLPVDVEEGGDMSRRTLVVTASAAAPNGGLASLVPGRLLQRVGYDRFVGAEYAKKVLLDSYARGWEIAD